MDHRDRIWNVPEDLPVPPVDPLDLDSFREYLAQALYQAGMPDGSVKGCQSSLGPGVLVNWHGRNIQCTLLERTAVPSGMKLSEIHKDVLESV